MRRLALMAVAAALVAACSGSSSGGGGGNQPLVIGILAPFTGADAALGPAYFAACLPAARAIDADGGVMGHQVSCKQFDTRGDPADADRGRRGASAGGAVQRARACS